MRCAVSLFLTLVTVSAAAGATASPALATYCPPLTQAEADREVPMPTFAGTVDFTYGVCFDEFTPPWYTMRVLWMRTESVYDEDDRLVSEGEEVVVLEERRPYADGQRSGRLQFTPPGVGQYFVEILDPSGGPTNSAKDENQFRVLEVQTLTAPHPVIRRADVYSMRRRPVVSAMMGNDGGHSTEAALCVTFAKGVRAVRGDGVVVAGRTACRSVRLDPTADFEHYIPIEIRRRGRRAKLKVTLRIDGRTVAARTVNVSGWRRRK